MHPFLTWSSFCSLVVAGHRLFMKGFHESRWPSAFLFARQLHWDEHLIVQIEGVLTSPTYTEQ